MVSALWSVVDWTSDKNEWVNKIVVHDCPSSSDRLMPPCLLADKCGAVRVIPANVRASFWWDCRSFICRYVLLAHLYELPQPARPDSCICSRQRINYLTTANSFGGNCTQILPFRTARELKMADVSRVKMSSLSGLLRDRACHQQAT